MEPCSHQSIDERIEWWLRSMSLMIRMVQVVSHRQRVFVSTVIPWRDIFIQPRRLCLVRKSVHDPCLSSKASKLGPWSFKIWTLSANVFKWAIWWGANIFEPQRNASSPMFWPIKHWHNKRKNDQRAAWMFNFSLGWAEVFFYLLILACLWARLKKGDGWT